MRPLREGGDSGTPLVVSDPDAPASIALVEAAEKIARATKSRVGKPLTIRPTGAAAVVNGGGNGHQHSGHEGHDHSAHQHAAHEH